MRHAKHLLAAVCAYEAVAIWTHRLPTVTCCCHRWRTGRGRWGVSAATVAFAGWLVWHLLVEGDR